MPRVKKDWRWILRQAAQVLEKEGWHQGSLTELETPEEVEAGIIRRHPGIRCARCLQGAIDVVCLRNDIPLEGEGAWRMAIRCAPSFWWNDAPGRTKEEVIQALLEAAA